VRYPVSAQYLRVDHVNLKLEDVTPADYDSANLRGHSMRLGKPTRGGGAAQVPASGPERGAAQQHLALPSSPAGISAAARGQ
jgi:hypothetical protein